MSVKNRVKIFEGKNGFLERKNWIFEENKLASLGATLVRNYDPLTYSLTH